MFCSLDQQVIRGKIQALAHNISYPEEETYHHHHYKLYQPSNIFCLPLNLISIKICINCTTCRSHSFSQAQNQKDLKSLHILLSYIKIPSSSPFFFIFGFIYLYYSKEKKKIFSACVCSSRNTWIVHMGKVPERKFLWLNYIFEKHNKIFSYLNRNLRKAVICMRIV